MVLGGVSTPVVLQTGWPLLGLTERVTQFAYLQWLLFFGLVSWRSAEGAPDPRSAER
jgi:hypothetical protein